MLNSSAKCFLLFWTQKPYTCDVLGCNKGFTQMGNLEKHIRVHTGERPYPCPLCHKSFSQSGYVAIHLRYAIRWQCNFAAENWLKKFISILFRTHTGEKPYRCDYENCGRAFAGSNTLAIHKRTREFSLNQNFFLFNFVWFQTNYWKIKHDSIYRHWWTTLSL